MEARVHHRARTTGSVARHRRSPAPLLNFVVSRQVEGRVVFADSYQATLAALGVRLRGEDACSDADIERAESRLAIKLPGTRYQALGTRNSQLATLFTSSA